MSVEVAEPTDDFGDVTEHLFLAATDYTVDPYGNLFLVTNLCQPVAMFAAGKWKYAKVVPNRGADGRFVKRGAA